MPTISRARLIPDAKAERRPSFRLRRISTRLTGRGFLCAILADSQTNARVGPTSSPKILPTLSRRAASARSRPQTAPDGSPSYGRPSPAPPPSSRPGYAPGNGGSDRELPYNQFHHAGRGPADRMGEECAPTPRPGNQDPTPLRRPPP